MQFNQPAWRPNKPMVPTAATRPDEDSPDSLRRHIGQPFDIRESETSMRTINDLSSTFASELEELTLSAGHGELAAQIRGLPVLDRCRCGQSNCAHFYTAPKPVGAYGPGHTNLMLPASRGLIVLDLVDGMIVAVEILDRPDVKRLLDAYLSK